MTANPIPINKRFFALILCTLLIISVTSADNAFILPFEDYTQIIYIRMLLYFQLSVYYFYETNISCNHIAYIKYRKNSQINKCTMYYQILFP